MNKKNPFEVSEKEFDCIKTSRQKQNCVPKNHPKRTDGETFWDFIEQGSQIMMEKNPKIIEELKNI